MLRAILLVIKKKIIMEVKVNESHMIVRAKEIARKEEETTVLLVRGGDCVEHVPGEHGTITLAPRREKIVTVQVEALRDQIVKAYD